MKVERFNIAKPEKYTKDNEEKTYWANVGTMTVFNKDDGSISRIMDIPAIGLKANIFPIKPKETVAPASQPATPTENSPTEEINPNDIPF